MVGSFTTMQKFKLPKPTQSFAPSIQETMDEATAVEDVPGFVQAGSRVALLLKTDTGSGCSASAGAVRRLPADAAGGLAAAA